MRGLLKYFILFNLLISTCEYVSAQESSANWPKEIYEEDYIITIYTPENSSYVDQNLKANVAFSVKKGINGTPIFGMMWITALLDVDRASRITSLVSVKVDEVRFPESVSESDQNRFKKLIESEVPQWNIEFPIGDLINSLEEVSTYSADLKTEPPVIIFSSEPAVLIFIDGEPSLRMASKGYELVQNTSSFIARETKSENYYLKGGDFWYYADDPLGPWKTTAKVPSRIKKLAKEASIDSGSEQKEEYNGTAPKIIVATQPSELILTDGAASFSPIQQTNLLYVENSEDDLFINIKDQQYYILISGRWFTAKDLSDSWKYVAADSLPEDFAKIPGDSEKAHVLANISGTKEAKNAVYDAQIPQTAAIQRDTEATEVAYNGTPEFKTINGLTLEYAVNTESSVFRDGNIYYLCDNAIWFTADSPGGPWRVADSRPEEVSQIPPENPSYNTKYVYIYETTPTVVYVGYTPGYYGSYVYGNTIFYGTGFYYNPWYNGFYYRHHFTYGFSIRYNPWYGWSFGFRFGSPYVWWGYGYWGRRYHHWGPPYYRPPYYRPGYRPRPSHPIYRGRRGVYRYQRPATRPETRPSRPRTRPEARPARPGTRPSTPTRPESRPKRPETKPSSPNRPNTRPSRPSTPNTRPNRPATPNTRPSRPSTVPRTRPAPRPARPSARSARPSRG